MKCLLTLSCLTGHSPEKLLFSHPLQANSSESDDAHSAAYLTSSEPSPSGQAPPHGQLSLSDEHPPLTELPYSGHGSSPLTVKEAAKLNSEEKSTPEGLWANAASPDSRVHHLVGSTPQQSGGQHLHQSEGAAPVHPTPTAMHASHHPRTVTSSEGADGQQTDAQPAGTADCTSSRQGYDVTEGTFRSPAAWTDTCPEATPLQPAYDPQRYQKQTSPEEASEHASLSAQALGTQPQLLGSSPRQAAIFKLRSLSVKQSQSAKPAVRRHSALTHASSSAQRAQQAQQAGSFGEVFLEDAISPVDVSEAHQNSITAEGQRSLPQVSASDHHQQHAAASHTAQTDPEPAHTHISAVPFPLSSTSRKAPPVMMLPPRSTSVAKLRTHSLAKHLQDQCHASVRSLISPTEPVCAAAAHTDAQTEACPQASVPSQARQSIVAAQETDAHTHRQQEEEELLDTADIDLTLGSEQASTASGPGSGPGPYQTELVPLTRSAEGLLHSESIARSPGVMTKPGLDRAQSKSEGCSPVSMTGSCKPMQPHSPNLHGSSIHRSASSAEAADSVCPAQHESSDSIAQHEGSGSIAQHEGSDSIAEHEGSGGIAQHEGSDSLVTVCISSTGAHATVSLEVQSQNSSDSHASPAPDSDLIAVKETHQIIADLAPTEVVASTHAARDMHHPSAHSHMGHGPVSCDTAEEDAREAAPATELSLASDAAKQSLHAQLPIEASGTTHDQAALQQPPEVEPTGRQSIQSAPYDDPLLGQNGGDGKGHVQEAIPCSPSRGGSRGEGTVLDSPGRQRSPRQSLFGRLEGGLRTLLGRTPKQVRSETSHQA